MLGKLLGRKKKTQEEKSINTQKSVKEAENMMGGAIPEITDEMIDQMLAGDLPGMPKLGPMQKMAMKSIKKMDSKKRKEMFAQSMGQMKEKGGESKEEMVKQIEEMREAGQLNSKQYKIAKKRLGIK